MNERRNVALYALTSGTFGTGLRGGFGGEPSFGPDEPEEPPGFFASLIACFTGERLSDAVWLVGENASL